MPKANSNGRKLYSMMDVSTTDGYAVLTKDFVDDLCAELKRLYEIEDGAMSEDARLAEQWIDATLRVIAELPADLRDKFPPTGFVLPA